MRISQLVLSQPCDLGKRKGLRINPFSSHFKKAKMELNFTQSSRNSAVCGSFIFQGKRLAHPRLAPVAVAVALDPAAPAPAPVAPVPVAPAPVTPVPAVPVAPAPDPAAPAVPAGGGA